MFWSRPLVQLTAVLIGSGMLAGGALLYVEMQRYWPTPATADEKWLLAASLEKVKRNLVPNPPSCISSLSDSGSADWSEARDWSGSEAHSGAELHALSNEAHGRPVQLALDSTYPALMWLKVWQDRSCDYPIILLTPRFKGDFAFVDIRYGRWDARVFAWQRRSGRWHPVGEVVLSGRPIY
jgi:hypothetical protein